MSLRVRIGVSALFYLPRSQRLRLALSHSHFAGVAPLWSPLLSPPLDPSPVLIVSSDDEPDDVFLSAVVPTSPVGPLVDPIGSVPFSPPSPPS